MRRSPQADFPWALDRLKEFNALVLKDKVLSERLIFGEYNFLQAYQIQVLLELVNVYKSRQTPTSNTPAQSSTSNFWIRLGQVNALIISALSYLFLTISRREVLVFTTDRETFAKYKCDFRLANIFKYLFDHKIKFIEVLHTFFRKGFVGAALSRGRAALYLEVGDVLYKIFGGQDVPLKSFKFASGENSELFHKLATKYAKLTHRSLFKVRLFNRLLKLTNLKVLLATADTKNGYELLAASNLNNIKTFFFQSGNLSKYSVGHLDCSGSRGRIIKPYRMMVESAYWKKELLRLGTYYPKDSVEVAGNTKEDYVPNNETLPQERHQTDDFLTVLIPYEIISVKEEMLAYIKKLTSYPKIKVVFKFRADRNLKEQASEYGLTETPANLELITDMEEIDHFDLVAGTYSTFLYEMIGKLKPVVVFKTSLDYGEGLIANDLAEELTLDEADLEPRLKRIVNTNPSLLEERRKKLFGEPIILSTALDKILRS